MYFLRSWIFQIQCSQFFKKYEKWVRSLVIFKYFPKAIDLFLSYEIIVFIWKLKIVFLSNNISVYKSRNYRKRQILAIWTTIISFRVDVFRKKKIICDFSMKKLWETCMLKTSIFSIYTNNMQQKALNCDYIWYIRINNFQNSLIIKKMAVTSINNKKVPQWLHHISLMVICLGLLY